MRRLRRGRARCFFLASIGTPTYHFILIHRASCPIKRCGIPTAILVMISMLVPGMGSVLCIAPKGHAAIEDINSECCASWINPVFAEGRRAIESSPANQCGNCTDILITPNVPGMDSSSKNPVIANSPAAGCSGIDNLASAGTGCSLLNCAKRSPNALVRLSSSAPLRC